MTKLLKLFLCGNGYCVINPVRSKVKRLKDCGQSLLTVVCCPLTTEGEKDNKRQYFQL